MFPRSCLNHGKIAFTDSMAVLRRYITFRILHQCISYCMPEEGSNSESDAFVNQTFILEEALKSSHA